MLTVDEALKAILASARTLATEIIPLLEARGAVLAEEIVADIDIPPFDNSAVDGYAVQAVDTAQASVERPVELKPISDIAAGVWTLRR